VRYGTVALGGGGVPCCVEQRNEKFRQSSLKSELPVLSGVTGIGPNKGRAVDQAVRRWLPTSEPLVQSRLTLCEIRGGQNGNGAGLHPSFFRFALLIAIPPLLHTHLSLPHEVCDSPDHAAHYHIQRSRYSDLLRAGGARGRTSSPGKVKNFLFFLSSRSALGSTQLLSNGYRGLFPRW
jgi:hypothetical protein